jgi:hypothetical protein
MKNVLNMDEILYICKLGNCDIVIDCFHFEWEVLGSNIFTMEIFIMDGLHLMIPHVSRIKFGGENC